MDLFRSGGKILCGDANMRWVAIMQPGATAPPVSAADEEEGGASSPPARREVLENHAAFLSPSTAICIAAASADHGLSHSP